MEVKTVEQLEVERDTAQAAAAEMREALKFLRNYHNTYLRPDSDEPNPLASLIDRALFQTAGTGWLSPQEAEKERDILLAQIAAKDAKLAELTDSLAKLFSSK